MNRKRDSAKLQAIDASVDVLESVTIDRGFALPRRSTDVDLKDIELYGQGRPLSLKHLKQHVAGIEQRISARILGHDSITESLAMAARNGEQISDAVRNRMCIDRDRAEQGMDKNG